MPVRIMSDAELTKYEILRDVDLERMPVRAAAQVLGLTERQVWRLLKAYRLRGADGLISKKRCQPSNRRTPDDVRLAAMAIVKERYADFGPTLAAEKLREQHGLTISRETLRVWMLEAGLWADRVKRRGRVYQPRYRRECVGELVQVDGSEHWWFEDRGPQCTLLVFIDDATSRLMHLQFVQSESTFAYFNATQRYLEQHGKPVAFYTDKHAVFRVNKPSGLHGDGMTQFGRALKALSIEIICANSSQAKGRVERANKTLQDRLVKELRLAGVSTMDDGNAFLPGFMADYNARFAKAPFNDKNLHRPMQDRDRLDEAFTWRAERTLSQSLTLQYDNILFMIEPSEFAQAAIGRRVEVVDFPDGRLEVRYKGRSMPYRTFDKLRRVTETAVLENKRLGGLLNLIRESQQTEPPGMRTSKGPKRRDQTRHMFSVG
ncbi:MAG TPA: ISNCY family transposase [Caulobacteraceae bacterium]|nr:ISNCY family transposase [Caulobacteraceae bacterium]